MQSSNGKTAHPRGWLSQRGRRRRPGNPRTGTSSKLRQASRPGHSCQNLFKVAPGLFPTVVTAAKASERTLAIDEATLNRFFEVVRKAAS